MHGSSVQQAFKLGISNHGGSDPLGFGTLKSSKTTSAVPRRPDQEARFKCMFDTLGPDQDRLIDQLAMLLRVDAGSDHTCSTAAAEAAIDRLYAHLGLNSPHVIWCDGPFQLSVAPVLLQLLVHDPDSSLRDKIGRKYGFNTIDGREAALTEVLTNQKWKQALASLLKQISIPSICELAYTDEVLGHDFEAAREQFGWSRCGLPIAEQLNTLAQNSITEAVRGLQQAATLGLATSLTSRLFTAPIDQIHRVKQTVSRWIANTEAISLRDTPSTILGSARGPMTGLYKRARELHEQIAGTMFEDLLASCPAPQADPRYKGARHLENDITVNTAGIFAFGPYQTLWGRWAGTSATCYSIIAGMFRDQFSKELRQLLSDVSALLRSGFAYTPLTRTIFICQFPSIHVDELQRLHCVSGPALEFGDGYRIYALCGVPVSPDIVDSPHLLDVRRIDYERNVELRRVLIERYGIVNYLRDSGAGIVHKSNAGTLYLKQQAGDEPIALVQVRNSTPEADGSYREYFLRVPPNMRTVQQAIAWTFGLDAEEYDPMIET